MKREVTAAVDEGCVAPRGGAGIETPNQPPSSPMRLSPLAEGRELKYTSGVNNTVAIVSPLAEGRELK